VKTVSSGRSSAIVTEPLRNYSQGRYQVAARSLMVEVGAARVFRAAFAGTSGQLVGLLVTDGAKVCGCNH
jgi:hypothetical protein